MEKSLRLTHLLNEGHSKFESKKSKAKDEYNEDDSINKYDSDEENKSNSSYESDSESSNDIENKEQEEEKINDDKMDLVFLHYETLSPFDASNFAYSEISLVQTVNNLPPQPQVITAFLVDFKNKVISESIESIDARVFYSSLWNYWLQKVFCMLKGNSLHQEILQMFPLITSISTLLIDSNLIENKKENDEYIQQALEVCNYTFEMYYLIISANKVSKQTEFISQSLEFIYQFMSHKRTKRKNAIKAKEEANIKKYIETIYQIISNLKQFCFYFSLDDYKYIFSICFIALSIQEFSNVFIILIDTISIIIESSNDISFIDKFIDNILLCFEDFLQHYDYLNDNNKIYIIKKSVLWNYKKYFGEYKCLNSENISLYSYLFLRFFSLIYLKDDFLQNFEKVLIKIFDWSKANILLCLYCLVNDFLKIKYNAEFSVVLIVLTNIYLSLTSFITQTDIEIHKKKLFLHIIEMFFIDLLRDFNMMRRCYLCFGEDGSKSIKTGKAKSKKQKCQCFSCVLTTANRKEVFHCHNCNWRTNLRLQLIDPDRDDNMSICGFCNMNSFFESCGVIFEKEKKLKLIDTNEELIKEYSKSKLNETKSKSKSKSKSKTKGKGKEDKVDKETESQNLFHKFIYYQDMLYKNAFLFLKISLLNFIRFSNKIENKEYTHNIDNSFRIFLKNLIKEQKIKEPLYQQFSRSVEQFYSVQKERLFNLHQDILIDEDTIKYFFFFHFYINLLFAGHWKVIDIIHTKSIHWAIRYKSLKILEKFNEFEGEDAIFNDFDAEIIAPLLSDSSFNIREFSFNILFKMYQNKKIERSHLIFLLYKNINESSFLIRKRIIIALRDLVVKENEREHLKMIVFIFLTKVIDNSESEKIKKLIYEFFISALTIQNKDKGELLQTILKILIELLNNSDDLTNGNNCISEWVSYLFIKIGKEIQSVDICVDYLMEKYLFNNEVGDLELVQALNLIRLFSAYHSKSIIIYLEYICNLINDKKLTKNINISNIILQYSCEIISNLFSQSNSKEANIKSHLISKMEYSLIMIILNKLSFVMVSALKAYFAMLTQGYIDLGKISTLVIQNFAFLAKIYKSGNLDNNIPEGIITKSLLLLCYVIYSLSDQQLNTIFANSEYIDDINKISDYIFNMLSFFTLYNKRSSILNFKTFEGLGFFWIKYPDFLLKSGDIINFITSNIKTEEDKIILLRTFYNFFSQISVKCKEKQLEQIEENKNIIKNKKSITSSNSKKNIKINNKIDYGSIHLFFEQFLTMFSNFIIEEKNPLLRISTMNLLKLIVNAGNINVYLILPNVFSALFDISSEVRYTSTFLLEKILNKSKDKFLSLIKECLKCAFKFQKKNYIKSDLINSFVKVYSDNDIVNSNESVFELFNYKIAKMTSINIQISFINKIIDVFKAISSIESKFSSSSHRDIKECLSEFEFYEFIAKLIGDFHYSKRENVIIIFDSIYPDFETYFCVFKSKLKDYKEDKTPQKMDMKLIFSFLISGLHIFLFKYLLIKFSLFTDDQIDKIHLNGWVEFLKMFEGLNQEKNKSKNKGKNNNNNKHTGLIPGNSEFKIMRFFEFYKIFECHCKDIFAIQMKRSGKFTYSDKIYLVDKLYALKNFESVKPKEFRDVLKVRNKKKNKDGLIEAYYELYFYIEKPSDNERIKKVPKNGTNMKLRKRVSLEENIENEQDDGEDEDKAEKEDEKKFITEKKGKKRKGEFRLSTYDNN